MELHDFRYVVAGSGLFGSVIAERIAGGLGQKVLVVEKRSHVGGNCYSEIDTETGIEYHKFGTHVFHTNNEKVWNYICQFTSFNNYRHRVKTSYRNDLYAFPLNLGSINQFYGTVLNASEMEEFLETKRPTYSGAPSNFEEKALSVLGNDLYEAFIKGYTLKQWQVDPKTLPPSIFDRLPVKNDLNADYFNDHWQGIPLNGYTKMFQNLLSQKNIKLLLATDFFSIKHLLHDQCTVIYSGPIDRYFDYCYGRLTWRTLEFRKEIIATGNFQGHAVVNFPETAIPFTRIHEPRHLHPERSFSGEKSLIFREYSLMDDGSDPFYPVLSNENIQKYELYKEKARQLHNVFISGRLGDYKYYDMHQTIARALEIYESQIAPKYSS